MRALRRIVEQDPADERGDNERGHRISGDNEVGVRPEIYVVSRPGCRHHACNSCACTKRILRTRRRKISLRMTAEMQGEKQQREGQRHDEKRHKAKAGSIVDPLIRKTEAGWCSVFHQSTENLMIGKIDRSHQREDCRRARPPAGDLRRSSKVPSRRNKGATAPAWTRDERPTPNKCPTLDGPKASR